MPYDASLADDGLCRADCRSVFLLYPLNTAQRGDQRLGMFVVAQRLQRQQIIFPVHRRNHDAA